MAVDTCKTVTCIHLESGQDGGHSADSCSPLCMCQCCGGVTLAHEFLLGLKANYTLHQKPLYTENSISEISYSIWQPPKV